MDYLEVLTKTIDELEKVNRLRATLDSMVEMQKTPSPGFLIGVSAILESHERSLQGVLDCIGIVPSNMVADVDREGNRVYSKR